MFIFHQLTFELNLSATSFPEASKQEDHTGKTILAPRSRDIQLSSFVHIILISFVPLLVFANRIQCFLLVIILFHTNLELLKGAGLFVLDAGFSVYL